VASLRAAGLSQQSYTGCYLESPDTYPKCKRKDIVPFQVESPRRLGSRQRKTAPQRQHRKAEEPLCQEDIAHLVGPLAHQKWWYSFSSPTARDEDMVLPLHPIVY
jgi:hypothetical protein